MALLGFKTDSNPLLAHVLKDSLPVCPRFRAALMDPQAIDLDHRRPSFDPLEKYAIGLLQQPPAPCQG